MRKMHPFIDDELEYYEVYLDHSDEERHIFTLLKAYILNENLAPPVLTIDSENAIRGIETMVSLIKSYDRQRAFDLIYSKENIKNEDIHQFVLQLLHRFSSDDILYIYEHYPEIIEKYLEETATLFKEAKKHLLLLKALQQKHPNPFKSKYEKYILEHLKCLTNPAETIFTDEVKTIGRYNVIYVEGYHKTIYKEAFDRLKTQLSPTEFKAKLHTLHEQSTYFPEDLISDYIANFGEQELENIINLINKDNKLEVNSLIFNFLDTVNWLPFEDKLWEKISWLKHYEGVKVFRQFPEKTIAYIKALPVNAHYYTKYYILAQLETKEAHQLLWNFFQTEPNEEVRANIIQDLYDKIYTKEVTEQEIEAIVDYAKKRKKLKSPGKTLDEKELPPLYLLSGKPLSKDMLRFLFYRLKTKNKFTIDKEAQLLLQLIDKSNTEKFVDFIVAAFFENGTQAKDKYLLILAGTLGAERYLDKFIILLNKSARGKRIVLAQSIITILDQIGNDKAYRFLFSILKKFETKESLVNGANIVLDRICLEKGISKQELEDKIIPDFGFEENFKILPVKEEEFRAYINKQFKIEYLTEENTIKKSLPRNAPAELKLEMKAIQKEINEVKKQQAKRLENYMIVSRSWKYDYWKKYYLNNPIMFAFIINLVWGIYDQENQLINTFYIDEDAAILDLEEDEIIINPEQSIKLIHPINLTTAVRDQWIKKFYELEIAQPFNQLTRDCYGFLETDKEKNYLNYYFKTVPSLSFIQYFNILRKNGFEFSVIGSDKHYPEINFTVSIDSFSDNYSEAYYLRYIHFQFKGFHRTKIKEVPPIILSETIAFLESFAQSRFPLNKIG